MRVRVRQAVVILVLVLGLYYLCYFSAWVSVSFCERERIYLLV